MIITPKANEWNTLCGPVLLQPHSPVALLFWINFQRAAVSLKVPFSRFIFCFQARMWGDISKIYFVALCLFTRFNMSGFYTQFIALS